MYSGFRKKATKTSGIVPKSRVTEMTYIILHKQNNGRQVLKNGREQNIFKFI